MLKTATAIVVFLTLLAAASFALEMIAPHYKHILDRHPFLELISYHSPWFFTVIAFCVARLRISFKITETFLVASLLYAGLDTGLLYRSGIQTLAILLQHFAWIVLVALVPALALAFCFIKTMKLSRPQT